MAILTDEEKNIIVRKFIRKAYEELRGIATVDVDDLKVAAQETENWISANQASFVASLNEPFRSNSTAAQKTLLFTAVLLKTSGNL